MGITACGMNGKGRQYFLCHLQTIETLKNKTEKHKREIGPCLNKSRGGCEFVASNFYNWLLPCVSIPYITLYLYSQFVFSI